MRIYQVSASGEVTEGVSLSLVRKVGTYVDIEGKEYLFVGGFPMSTNTCIKAGTITQLKIPSALAADSYSKAYLVRPRATDPLDQILALAKVPPDATYAKCEVAVQFDDRETKVLQFRPKGSVVWKTKNAIHSIYWGGKGKPVYKKVASK